MTWTVWLIGAAVAFLPGAYFFRAGKPKIVRVYFAACAVLAISWVFGLGELFGEAFAAWPKALFATLAPATLVLAIQAVRRDRERVMGNPQDRDAVATAAVLYGAAHTTEIAGDIGGDAGADGGGF